MKVKILLFLALLINGCFETSTHPKKVYYISYITGNDSLLATMKKSTAGKASYFDQNRELQFLSVNYLTEAHPRTHYFRTTDELMNQKPGINTIKYEVVFNDKYVNDSIAYSLKKYIYTDKGWKLRSDMGVIKVFDYLSDYDKKLRIIYNNIAKSVVRTIANDTYGD